MSSSSATSISGLLAVAEDEGERAVVGSGFVVAPAVVLGSSAAERSSGCSGVVAGERGLFMLMVTLLVARLSLDGESSVEGSGGIEAAARSVSEGGGGLTSSMDMEMDILGSQTAPLPLSRRGRFRVSWEPLRSMGSLIGDKGDDDCGDVARGGVLELDLSSRAAAITFSTL